MSDTGINERLESFGKAVLKHAQLEKNELFERAYNYNSQEIEKSENEQLQQIHDMIKTQVANIELESTRKVSKAIIENKKGFYEKRHECLNNIFELAKQKLSEFAKTDDYKKFIIKKASELPQYANSVIKIKASDLHLADQIEKAYPMQCDVLADENIEIGGIILENEAQGIYIDESFESILSENKDWFCAQSGLIDD